MENKKVKIYGVVLGVILFILLVSGLTYAILNWRSSNITIAGNSECLEVDSVKGSNITGSDLLLLDESEIINNNRITITSGMVVTNITAKLKSSCKLDGYLTINLKTTTLNSGFTSSGNSTGALKYVLASYNPSIYTTVSTSALSDKTFDIIETGSITSTGTLKIKEVQLSNNPTLGYIVIFYIDGDKANNDIGSNSTSFKTSIEASITQGYVPTTGQITTSTVLATQITNLYNEGTNTIIPSEYGNYQYNVNSNLTKDLNNNIRYYGTDPNNYIYFNCSDYSKQSSSTCEIWRIIGVFDGKIKLIKNDSIGLNIWNRPDNVDSSTDFTKSVWPTASLMKLLNPGYESETIGGSLYYNSKSGECYDNDNSSGKHLCDFTSTGIKNAATRSLISDTNYTLPMIYQDGRSGEPNIIYKVENEYYDGSTYETWTGKIAIPYASDFAYATDLNMCKDVSTFKSPNPYVICRSYNWLANNGNSLWFINHFSNAGCPGGTPCHAVSSLDYNGEFKIKYVEYSDYVYPVLYLNTGTAVVAGNGTIVSPYQISVN